MPANNVMVGDAVIHGVPNTGTAITMEGYSTFYYDKVELEHMFESYFTGDSQGNHAAGTAFNEHCEIVMDFVPIGATRAAAATNPLLSFPPPLSNIALSNLQCVGEFASSSVTILNSAYLIYVGGARLSQTSTGAAKLTGMKVRVYANAAQAALMATQISG